MRAQRDQSSRISEALEVSLSTIAHMRQRFVEPGLQEALDSRQQEDVPPERLEGNQFKYIASPIATLAPMCSAI
jgi:hypothetical protein